ncbi:MAG TPA: hypothetical protein VK741_25790 [Acetobacteraceae bacterium]|nr:hypothetical protein [Acetobacteraceae bacterium]
MAASSTIEADQSAIGADQQAREVDQPRAEADRADPQGPEADLAAPEADPPSSRADRRPGKADRAAAEVDQDRVKPWTIKGIAPEIRNAAIAAAERDNQTLGEWFSRAIPAMVQQQRARNRLPVMVVPPGRPDRLPADLGEIERVITLMASLHGVSNKPAPANLVRLAHGLLRDRLSWMKKGGQTDAPAAVDSTAARSDQIPVQADSTASQSDQGE